jgi:excisionase family DNA binding protein
VTDTRVAASTHPANREARRHPATQLLAEAGPTMSAADSAKVLGISLNTLYAAIKRGDLGVRTLRYGQRWRIPTADLRRLVGLEAGTDERAAHRSEKL